MLYKTWKQSDEDEQCCLLAPGKMTNYEATARVVYSLSSPESAMVTFAEVLPLEEPTPSTL